MSWICFWNMDRIKQKRESSHTSVICSSFSSKGLPSFLLKKVATPTISSFLLTIGRARTFLIFHPVSSTPSFCHVQYPDYTSLIQGAAKAEWVRRVSPERQSIRLLQRSSCCRSRWRKVWVCGKYNDALMQTKQKTYKSILSHICGKPTDQSPVVCRRATVSTDTASYCTNSSLFSEHIWVSMHPHTYGITLISSLSSSK